MADTNLGGLPANPEDPKAAKKQLKADKKEYQKLLKQQRKEAKEKAQEFADRTAEINGDNAGGFATIVITFLIILIWIAIMALLIKLDVGGFGSDILAPLIKDVPYLNVILPEGSVSKSDSSKKTATTTDTATTDVSGTASSAESLEDANETIKKLESVLATEMQKNTEYLEKINQLEAAVQHLEPFEQQQKEFWEERAKFYSEVVYGDKAPDESAYAAYYEMIDPDNAKKIYEEVIKREIEDSAIQNFADTYSTMKAKQAASIFDEMINENHIDIVSKILAKMSTENRSDILAAMDKANAAKVTQLLKPSSLDKESTQVPGNK